VSLSDVRALVAHYRRDLTAEEAHLVDADPSLRVSCPSGT
jgi:hypothetical protein